MVNFWSSVFELPKHFYAKVDSLCSAFLWKNKTGSAAGARVAWKDLCRPKEEGGLGIRLLEDFEVVFRLKHIWNFFSKSGSLWVAWLKENIFWRKSYWLTNEANCFSKTINSMLQLKPTVSEFLKCEETLVQGCFAFRIRKDARVVEASRNGNWVLPAAVPAFGNSQALMVALTDIVPPAQSNGRDTFLWRNIAGNYCPSFSSKETWEQIRTHSPLVLWADVVWFKEHVPRFSFITWLALLNHLPTRDRLRRWGMNTPASCVLCSTGVETHEHLFFECSYSTGLWGLLAAKFFNNPPFNLPAAASWILLFNLPHQSKASTVLKLLFQSVIYHIWRERN
ncbi:unnamed protein product [Arabidopsis halleri]